MRHRKKIEEFRKQLTRTSTIEEENTKSMNYNTTQIEEKIQNLEDRLLAVMSKVQFLITLLGQPPELFKANVKDPRIKNILKCELASEMNKIRKVD